MIKYAFSVKKTIPAKRTEEEIEEEIARIMSKVTEEEMQAAMQKKTVYSYKIEEMENTLSRVEQNFKDICNAEIDEKAEKEAREASAGWGETVDLFVANADKALEDIAEYELELEEERKRFEAEKEAIIFKQTEELKREQLELRTKIEEEWNI